MIKFSHDGNMGDVIYSLPFCITNANDSSSSKFDFHLRINQPAQYCGNHPLGNIRMNMEVANNIKKLLDVQPYIDNVSISDKIPDGFYSLSKFRDLNFVHLACGSISQWYNPLSFTMTTPPNLSKPWIYINKPFQMGCKKIVLFRSSRYHRKNLNYSFLKPYQKQILFIGLEQEKQDFEKEFFKVDFYKVSDFLEAARIIKSATLVIGNQTGLFSLAESMKVHRLLETSWECPNVVMMGGSFQYIMHSSQFIEVFKVFYDHFVRNNDTPVC